MIRIKNPDILREKVRKIETKIKTIVDKKYRGYNSTRYSWSDSPVLIKKVEVLLEDRASYLNCMFTGTPEEVKRFEMLNEKFIKMADDMRARAAIMWESLLSMKNMTDYDDVYEVRGELYIDTWKDVLKLPDDDYYGSDFLLMSEIIQMVIPSCLTPAHCHYVAQSVDLVSEKTDRICAFSDSMEDGRTWAEGYLRHPALSHICICYPIHFLCADNPYSIPDLLRIDDFRTAITLEVGHSESQESMTV